MLDCRLTWSRFTRGLLILAVVGVVGCASHTPAPPPAERPAQQPREQPIAQQPHAPAHRVDAQAQHCLALAMYWEARGEGRYGMQAVGAVILNRVADPRFPNTPCGVVYQGGETPPCQFSWWCDGKSDRPTNRAQWNSALAVAAELLTDPPRDATGGALFFHSVAIRSPWQRQRTARIGNHVFYR